jgi:prepilin-type N-terminal cleavage/methylation domain-containing protein
VSGADTRPCSRAAHAGSGGFTLLEVMAAVAILALTLVVLLNIITNNMRATAHAQMVTTATFLARGKMVSMEDVIIEVGFQDLDEEDEGTFEEEGFPAFNWASSVEKIQLPTEAMTKVQKESGQASTSADPMKALTGMVGGMMGSFIEPVRVGLEESVRRVTLRVFWNERGRPEQSVEVVTYMTDPAKLDLALNLGAIAAQGQAQTAAQKPTKQTGATSATGTGAAR